MRLIKIVSYFTWALYKIIHSRIQKFLSTSGDHSVTLVHPIANYGTPDQFVRGSLRNQLPYTPNCTLGPVESHFLINFLKAMIPTLLPTSLIGTRHYENAVLFQTPIGNNTIWKLSKQNWIQICYPEDDFIFNLKYLYKYSPRTKMINGNNRRVFCEFLIGLQGLLH